MHGRADDPPLKSPGARLAKAILPDCPTPGRALRKGARHATRREMPPGRAPAGGCGGHFAVRHFARPPATRPFSWFPGGDFKRHLNFATIFGDSKGCLLASAWRLAGALEKQSRYERMSLRCESVKYLRTPSCGITSGCRSAPILHLFIGRLPTPRALLVRVRVRMWNWRNGADVSLVARSSVLFGKQSQVSDVNG